MYVAMSADSDEKERKYESVVCVCSFLSLSEDGILGCIDCLHDKHSSCRDRHSRDGNVLLPEM